MTATVGLQLVNAFKEPIQKLAKNIKEEFLFVYNNGLSDYIDNYYEKYSTTKTFIYRDEKVNFYDIFYPVTIKNRSEAICEINELQKLFSAKRFITIIGLAGSGKSMLMRHIFLQTVKQYYSIPIVIELRNLNDFNGSITDYIYKILTKNKLANTDKIIERVLSEGNYIFLFDGYDEIYSAQKNKITSDLEEFIDTYHKNTFVLTSRPGANAESLQRFDNFYVQPLNNKQINEFIHLQFKNHENKESIGKIISVVEKPDNKDYKDYLSNPLLLSMFIFTFNTYPEIPKTKNKFYWNVFDTLCTKHDSFTKKGFWLHERKSKLLNEDFENLLKWFSYITIFKGKYNFDIDFLKSNLLDLKEKFKLQADIDAIIYDLTVSISILIQDGTEFTFPHKSLQEYFTALLIKGLNEEQKQKIYTDKFNNLKGYTVGGNMNLYKLCFELDKFFFSKYYLIPNAAQFVKSINSSNLEQMTKSFVKEFDLKLNFTKSESGTYNLSSYEYNYVPIDSYLAFFHAKNIIPGFTDSTLKIAIPIISNDLDRKPTSKGDSKNEKIKKLDILKDWNENVSKFIIDSGIAQNFSAMFKEITDNFKILEQDISNETNNTKQLLDI